MDLLGAVLHQVKGGICGGDDGGGGWVYMTRSTRFDSVRLDGAQWWSARDIEMRMNPHVPRYIIPGGALASA